MMRALLTIAPYLLVAPAIAAPALVERDVCNNAVTETKYVTATLTVHAGAAATAVASGESVEHYSPQGSYVPQASPAAVSAQSAKSAPSASPAAHQPAPAAPPKTNTSTPSPDHGRSGYQNSLYFTNWGIYGANFQPQQIPADKVTRILYAFADIGSDGEVKSSDTYADLEKHYPTDSWNDQGKNAYGCIKQLYMLKKQNRQLKVQISIGGWTYSPKFPPVAATEAGRQKFASSAVKLVSDWGFDGIDIDWEYPANPTEAQNFVLLLKACREALDDYADKHAQGYHFIITVASPAGPKNYNNMDLQGMDQYVDGWNLMAYDYAGSWDSTSGHQANIYPDPRNSQATKFSTEAAVRDYASKGISTHKIMLGLPLYGRSFESTSGLGETYNGVGSGSIQSGVWLYKDLPKSGAKEAYDDVAGASYSYDPSTKELISYDNVNSATQKSQYLMRKGLGGAVFWEASGDRPGQQSLVGAVSGQMGRLDNSPNLLRYPTSQYDNIKAGMPGA